MWVAAAIAIAVVVFALRFGAPVAGGSDSYGYVSQAHLWATGRMSDELRLASELVPAVNARVLVPLAYHLARDQKSMVPSYASGLPLTMAVFERLAGPRAVFWVVPLLGGVAVWSTYLLGRRAGGPLAGAIAATLLAASPAFLFQVILAPMSDLPAAAWWTLTLALLFIDRAWAAPAAALTVALAVLTRPNLVPVAVVPLLLSTWRAIDEGRSGGGEDGRRRGRRDLVFLAGGVAVASLAVAAINTRLFGSPLSSGYDVRGLFALEHARPNLVRYPILLTAMHTPLVWLAALAPWLVGRRAALRRAQGASAALPPRPESALATVGAAALVVAVFACYLFYPGFDGHQTLRFLVPGLPALMVLLGAAIAIVTARLPAMWRAVALVGIVGLIVARGITFNGVPWFIYSSVERRYEVIGDAIARRLPANAVILAMQHSGSVRYYAGREIVRWDQIPEHRLDRLMKRLRRLGRPAYLLLDDWEVPEFKQRFENRSVLGALDWPPVLELDHVHVRVWDLTDRARRQPQRTRTTEVLPWLYPR
jgi:hypothetical protein